MNLSAEFTSHIKLTSQHWPLKRVASTCSRIKLSIPAWISVSQLYNRVALWRHRWAHTHTVSVTDNQAAAHLKTHPAPGMALQVSFNRGPSVLQDSQQAPGDNTRHCADVRRRAGALGAIWECLWPRSQLACRCDWQQACDIHTSLLNKWLHCFKSSQLYSVATVYSVGML